jgi:hypothetical protein
LIDAPARVFEKNATETHGADGRDRFDAIFNGVEINRFFDFSRFYLQ